MKHNLLLGLFIICLVLPAYGNIAAPYGERPVAGDFFTEDDNAAELRIESELLILDVSKPYGEGSPCSAEYTVLNLVKQHVDIDLLFLTPSVSNVMIFINGEEAQSVSKEIPLEDIPWVQRDDLPPNIKVYTAEEFPVHFDPGEQKKILVQFSLKPGWHNMSTGTGLTYPQAAHMLNMLKDAPPLSWYVYDLFSAATFGSDQFDLEIMIKTPKNTKFLSDLPLTPISSPDDDCHIFTGTFTELPARLVDFKVAYIIDYNFLGLTAGLGCGIPFDGRGVHFLSRMYADLFFWNHQISCGIDADPFSGTLHGVLLYTLFPPGRSNNFYLHAIDIRGGGGVIYDLSGAKGPGIRFFAGLKLFLPVYQFYYEFFPFSEDEIYRHELGILCVMGI